MSQAYSLLQQPNHTKIVKRDLANDKANKPRHPNQTKPQNTKFKFHILIFQNPFEKKQTNLPLYPFKVN